MSTRELAMQTFNEFKKLYAYDNYVKRRLSTARKYGKTNRQLKKALINNRHTGKSAGPKKGELKNLIT
jgi:superfamily II DNA/RNA helicase